MIELDPRVVLGQWVRVLFETLARCGIEDVVISPGSRNTPLTFGAVKSGAFRCHSVIDERSAAFFALGLTRTTRAGVALVCTSGSAGAHYLPALVEAHEAGVPLLVITADRPSHLQDCGAPQTIDQSGLFGRFARSAPKLGEPSAEPNHLDALIRISRQAVLLMHEGRPSPVHLNFPCPKPLEPLLPASDRDRELSHACDLRLARIDGPLPHPSSTVSEAAIRTLNQDLQADGERVLVTVGPCDRELTLLARTFANRRGFPCLVELPQGGAGGVLPFLADAILGGRSDLIPTHILHIGPICVSGSWTKYVDGFSGRLTLLPGTRFEDPTNRAHQVLVGDLSDALSRLDAMAAPPPPASSAFQDAYEALSRDLKRLVHDAISHGPSPETLSEIVATRAILVAGGSAERILVGNSLPLRLVGWLASTCGVSEAEFVTTRGANGIDGLIATASATATASRKATLAILGDVTTLHDVGSLSLAGRLDAPLVLVVLDNSGGRIFEHLPVREATDEVTFEFLRTPPRIDWENLAGAFSLKFASPSDTDSLTSAITGALQHPGATLVVVKVDWQSTFTFLAQVRSGLQGAHS